MTQDRFDLKHFTVGNSTVIFAGNAFFDFFFLFFSICHSVDPQIRGHILHTHDNLFICSVQSRSYSLMAAALWIMENG